MAFSPPKRGLIWNNYKWLEVNGYGLFGLLVFYLNSYKGGVEIVLLQKLSLPVLSLILPPSFQIMGITPKVKAFQRANVQSYNRGSNFFPLLLFDQQTGKEEVKCTVQDKDTRWSAEQGL